MSKKDFIALADFIKEWNAVCPISERFSKAQIGLLARFQQETNPRFNSARWISYIANECGPNGGTVRQ